MAETWDGFACEAGTVTALTARDGKSPWHFFR